MHKYTWLVWIATLITGFNNWSMLSSCTKNESSLTAHQSLLLSVMQSNLQKSINCSKKNTLTPLLTYLSYGSFFNKPVCEIDFFKKKERIGHVAFTCQRTNDPKIRSVFIDYLCVKDCYRHQGVGRLIMTQLIQFFQKLACTTQRSIIFHLTSATISELPIWCGQCNTSIKDQQIMRKKFYTSLGLKELTPSFSLFALCEWLEYTIFGEPVDFGVFFNISPPCNLPEPFTKQNFNTIDVTKNKNPSQHYSPCMHQFFKQLKFYLLPLFAQKTKNQLPFIYPFISKNFTFNKNTENSALASFSYAVNAYPPKGSRARFPLITASRSSEKAPWKIYQEGTDYPEINNLQKSFAALLTTHKHV